MVFEPQHISVSIHAPADLVYKFAVDPRNLPRWAAGLSDSIVEREGEWFAESPMGEIKIEFARQNEFGILDHYVTLPSGERFYNPMRVFSNDAGCEVVFTLFRWQGVSDEDHARDAASIKKDLETLKRLSEGA